MSQSAYVEGLSKAELVKALSIASGRPFSEKSFNSRAGVVQRIRKESSAETPEALERAIRQALETPRSSKTIHERSNELLLQVVETRDGRGIGYSYEEMLAIILREYPGAQTSTSCLRWYAVKLNQDPSVRMPIRPRKRPAPPDGGA